jgi:hypothetical protein
MEFRVHQSAVQDACHDKVSRHPLHGSVIFSDDPRDNGMKLFPDAGFKELIFHAPSGPIGATYLPFRPSSYKLSKKI